MRFQYKLEGADAEWSAPRARRSVYAKLAPGRYRFAVQALGTEGLLSQTDAALGFTSLPPLYRRWWFVAWVVAIVLAVLDPSHTKKIFPSVGLFLLSITHNQPDR